MRQFISPLLILGGLGLSAAAMADATAEISVDKGSLASVELVVQITTSFGTDTDNDTQTKSFTGVGTAVSALPPFARLDLPSLQFDLGSASFGFEFFCLPIIGCQGFDDRLELHDRARCRRRMAIVGGTAAIQRPVRLELRLRGDRPADIVGSNVVRRSIRSRSMSLRVEEI